MRLTLAFDADDGDAVAFNSSKESTHSPGPRRCVWCTLVRDTGIESIYRAAQSCPDTPAQKTGNHAYSIAAYSHGCSANRITS